jgi:hypothetical protein
MQFSRTGEQSGVTVLENDHDLDRTKAAEDFLERMHQLRYEFILEFGRDPDAYLLGPMEWLVFTAAMRERYFPYCTSDPTHFEGLPVRVKTDSGVGFMVPAEFSVSLIRSGGRFRQ